MKKRIKGCNHEGREHASKYFESPVYYKEPLQISDAVDKVKCA
jgi:hypothetical protein